MPVRLSSVDACAGLDGSVTPPKHGRTHDRCLPGQIEKFAVVSHCAELCERKHFVRRRRLEGDRWAPDVANETWRGREIGMITTFHNTRLAPHLFNVSRGVRARRLGDRARGRWRRSAPFMPVKNRNEGSAGSKATVQGNAPSRNCASSDRLRTDANPRRHRPAVAW
jgi:hypothetical protein